jgi:hypothetical protein
MSTTHSKNSMAAFAIVMGVVAVGCSGEPVGRAATAALITGPTLISDPVSAAGAAAQVCHTLGNGAFVLLSVNANAVASHLGHGDGQPGSEASGGFMFSNSCELVRTVTGVWVGESISYDAGAECGRDRNLMRLTLEQSGTAVSGEIYTKILESFYPPDVGMERTRTLASGSVAGNTLTFTYGPSSLFVGSATFSGATMTGTITNGSACPADTFTLTRQ